MIIRKLVALAASAIVVVTVAACGGTKTTTATHHVAAPAVTTTTTATTDPACLLLQRDWNTTPTCLPPRTTRRPPRHTKTSAATSAGSGSRTTPTFSPRSAASFRASPSGLAPPRKTRPPSTTSSFSSTAFNATSKPAANLSSTVRKATGRARLKNATGDRNLHCRLGRATCAAGATANTASVRPDSYSRLAAAVACLTWRGVSEMVSARLLIGLGRLLVSARSVREGGGDGSFGGRSRGGGRYCVRWAAGGRGGAVACDADRGEPERFCEYAVAALPLFPAVRQR